MMRRSICGGGGGKPIPLALVISVCLCLCSVSGHSDERPANDEISLERMQVFVKFENGTTFGLMIEPNYSVENLWYDIYTLEGVPWDCIKLKLGDKSLHYGQKLSDHSIQAGTTLTLAMPKDYGRSTTNFIVRTRDGRELPVASVLSNTIASLKDNITQLTGIPQVEQRLLIKGKELRDDRKLVQYEFYHGAMVELGRPLEDCRKAATIFVKTMSGAKVAIEVDLADTANSLKDKIWVKTGALASVQRLFVDESVIAGDNRLCDLGLEAGSTVRMVLFSTQITSLDQVARLQEPPVVNLPQRAPIFREADDVAKPCDRPAASLFKDARNWVIESSSTRDASLFDPVVRLTPNPDDEQSIKRKHEDLEHLLRSNASESERLEAVVVQIQIKLSSAVRPYRVASNLSSVRNHKQQPGFTLGGGSIEVGPEQVIPLGADVNNWSPDAFSDSDVMRLFEVSERVRRVLARDAQTGEGTLGIASQKRINTAILMTYLGALAGNPPSVECKQPKGSEACGICFDDLTSAGSTENLVCGHKFHADCIQTWVTSSYQGSRFPSCPLCRQPFMFPYTAQGKADLEAPELNLDC